jgi:hypothetical protein
LATCSPTCPSSPATTSAYGPPPTCFSGSSGFALTGAKADEREILLGIFAADPTLLAARPGQTLITDKHYFGRQFEAELTAHGVWLLRPARKGEPERAGARLLKPLRQVIESINDTFKALPLFPWVVRSVPVVAGTGRRR